MWILTFSSCLVTLYTLFAVRVWFALVDHWKQVPGGTVSESGFPPYGSKPESAVVSPTTCTWFPARASCRGRLPIPTCTIATKSHLTPAPYSTDIIVGSLRGIPLISRSLEREVPRREHYPYNLPLPAVGAGSLALNSRVPCSLLPRLWLPSLLNVASNLFLSPVVLLTGSISFTISSAGSTITRNTDTLTGDYSAAKMADPRAWRDLRAYALEPACPSTMNLYWPTFITDKQEILDPPLLCLPQIAWTDRIWQWQCIHKLWAQEFVKLTSPYHCSALSPS